MRVDKTVFTLYETGTLFSTAPTNEVAVKLHEEISGFLGVSVETPSRKFLIGLDETGKGEVLGHSILVGVVFPSSLLRQVEDLVNLADTKRRKSVSYWDNLFVEIDGLRSKGLDFVMEKIPPWHVDKYNLKIRLWMLFIRGFFLN